VVTAKADVFSAGRVLLRMLAFHVCDSIQDATNLLLKWDNDGTKSAVAELQRRLLISLQAGNLNNDARLAACTLARNMTLEDSEDRLSATKALSHPFLSKKALWKGKNHSGLPTNKGVPHNSQTASYINHINHTTLWTTR